MWTALIDKTFSLATQQHFSNPCRTIVIRVHMFMAEPDPTSFSNSQQLNNRQQNKCVPLKGNKVEKSRHSPATHMLRLNDSHCILSAEVVFSMISVNMNRGRQIFAWLTTARGQYCYCEHLGAVDMSPPPEICCCWCENYYSALSATVRSWRIADVWDNETNIAF